MLILSRGRDEQIVIGDDITITVLDFYHGNTVRLGIDAPREVLIHRKEIADQIARERRERDGLGMAQ